MNEAPAVCCGSGSFADLADRDDVRLILHARTRAGRANDAAAKKSQMDEVMGTATAMGNVWFHNPKDKDEWNQQKRNMPLSSTGLNGKSSADTVEL